MIHGVMIITLKFMTFAYNVFAFDLCLARYITNNFMGLADLLS